VHWASQWAAGRLAKRAGKPENFKNALNKMLLDYVHDSEGVRYRTGVTVAQAREIVAILCIFG